jgi:hypothetical protein
MPKLIIEKEDGTQEEYTTFFAVTARDMGDSAEIRQAIGIDCRVLVAGAMLKKAIIKADVAWNEFVKRAFPTPPLTQPDDEALQNRIKYSVN